MRFTLSSILLLILAGQASAEVCIENDSTIPENAFSFAFVPVSVVNKQNPTHPTLINPASPIEFSNLAIRADSCIEFKETTPPGTAGYLVISIKPPATSERAYASEEVIYVSEQMASAPATSTLMLAVESKVGDVIAVRSKLDDKPFQNFPMQKVIVPSSK
jgi:hypothetical protein